MASAPSSNRATLSIVWGSALVVIILGVYAVRSLTHERVAVRAALFCAVARAVLFRAVARAVLFHAVAHAATAQCRAYDREAPRTAVLAAQFRAVQEAPSEAAPLETVLDRRAGHHPAAAAATAAVRQKKKIINFFWKKNVKFWTIHK